MGSKIIKMKNFNKIFLLLTISMALIISSCSKENVSSKEEDPYKSVAYEEADFMLKGDGKFEKVITKPLVKIEGCRFIVEGTIEFYKNNELVCTIDFGDGECDDIATKTVDGETIEFSLKRLKKRGKFDYEKVIVEPIVKLEDCKYIVAGVVEFYKDNTWVATIDFGDGECDEWATKTWDGGSKVFSMKKW
jgi:hypothetical protein